MLGVEPADITRRSPSSSAASRRRRSRSAATSTRCSCAPPSGSATTRRRSALIAVPSRTLGQVPLTDVITLGDGAGDLEDHPPEPRARRHHHDERRRPGYAESAIVGGAREGDQGRSTCRRATRPSRSVAARRWRRCRRAFMFAIVPRRRLHVPGARGAVRVVAAPAHHPAVAAADGAVRAAVAACSPAASLNIFSMLGLLVLFAW